MATDYTPIRGLMFYSFGGTSCWSVLLNCKKFNKVYIRLSKQSTFTKDGEEQTRDNYVLYTVPAAEALLGVLSGLINDAKRFKGVQYISGFLKLSENIIVWKCIAHRSI